ncbi:aminodeoxychorismate/anthranilate synthase component II [uncultured Levyella sp.]|uniref:anthranilate synthase component II n=1 Tax=uncultured Levyella sp. TaxID=1715800 RepID=UPI00258E00F5|nr:aminodeoxychorismate/anthranilate synthase component II [uncultured Levyella sp.]
MLLMIDNYDSFVFNLLSYFEELGEAVDIISAGDFEEADPAWAEKYDAILLSPGPKGPKDATLCLSVMEKLAGRIPILGVCLGHQVIAHALGATVEKGDRPYHGKLSPVFHKKQGLFFNLPNPFTVTRYHSLAVKAESLPARLRLDAWTEDGTVMAISSEKDGIYGVQFHPEALLTEEGHEILANFLLLAKQWREQHAL